MFLAMTFGAFFFMTLLPNTSLASIGPATDLHIKNSVLSLDGYSREHAVFILPDLYLLLITRIISTVVAEGTFPGPLITGNVASYVHLWYTTLTAINDGYLSGRSLPNYCV